MIPFLNPFKELIDQPREIVERLLRERQEESKARKEYQESVKAYRELLKNPAYKPVYQRAYRALGMNLKILVEHASKCRGCTQYATQVKALQEIVLDPIEEVWQADLREKVGEEEVPVG